MITPGQVMRSACAVAIALAIACGSSNPPGDTGTGNANGNGNENGSGPPHAVAGRVFQQRLGGATVTLSNGMSTRTSPVDGSYHFSAPSGGRLTITASQPGLEFTPASIEHPEFGMDLILQNFWQVCTVGGTVTGPGTGAGVTVNLLEYHYDYYSTLDQTTTDAAGAYTFSDRCDLLIGKDVQPAKAGITFGPPLGIGSDSFDEVGHATLDFASAYTISGTVHGVDSCITVTLSGDASASTYACITASSGSDAPYSFTVAEGTYTITPTPPSGHGVSPASAIVTIQGAGVVQDFEVTSTP